MCARDGEMVYPAGAGLDREITAGRNGRMIVSAKVGTVDDVDFHRIAGLVMDPNSPGREGRLTPGQRKNKA